MGLIWLLVVVVLVLSAARTPQIPALRKQGRPTMSKFAIVVLVTVASLSSALASKATHPAASRISELVRRATRSNPTGNMTGPSLANLWGRKAGSLPSFDRYSDALKLSGIIWTTARSTDGSPIRSAWSRTMTCHSKAFKDARVRADLLAFLKEATKTGRCAGADGAGASEGHGGNDGWNDGRRADPN